MVVEKELAWVGKNLLREGQGITKRNKGLGGGQGFNGFAREVHILTEGEQGLSTGSKDKRARLYTLQQETHSYRQPENKLNLSLQRLPSQSSS